MSGKPNAGHRGRMMKRFESDGMSLIRFYPHEALEVFLFLLIPRVNTNHTAHSLLERFGSFDEIFHAPLNALTEIRGISKKTAAGIRFFGAVLDLAGENGLLTDDKDDK